MMGTTNVVEVKHSDLPERMKPIDPAKVHAAMKDGLLSIRAEIARGSNVIVFMPKAA